MKRILSALTMVLAAACFADGAGMAPINPAFLKWKARQERREAEKAAQTNQVTKSTISAKVFLQSADQEDDDLDFGLRPATVDMSYLSCLNTRRLCAVSDSDLPSSYRLPSNRLTPIKDQSPFGTCWAHATMASIESSLLMQGKGSFDFSEKNLVNTHDFDWPGGKIWNGTNEGGNAFMAMSRIVSGGGPVYESRDPYPASGDPNPQLSNAMSADAHVMRVRWIPPRTSPLDNDDIKRAIREYGALFVSYSHASSCVKKTAAGTTYYYPYQYYRNHAVAVVGWDDSFSRNNFAYTPSGDGAYLVRNSWGTDWGDDGYFWVSYYDKTFAYYDKDYAPGELVCAFVQVEDSSNYSTVYQYDPLGYISSVGYKTSTAYGAAIFDVAKNESITAVGFYAVVPNVAYEISVYSGVSANAPKSGTLAASKSGTADDAGFVIVSLDSTVSVSAGQRFSVVLKLNTPGYNYPLAFECSIQDYSSKATATSGQTFLSSNGTLWSDFVKVDASASFCVKAYASANVVSKTLTAINCYSSDNSTKIGSGKTKQFTCKATYSDGSEKVVSPSWSITSGGSYGSISSSGLFAAASVTSEQNVGVKASYTEGGVTKTSAFTVTITVSAPNAPTGLTATAGTESSCVRLAWTAANGATGYAVYRATGSGAASSAAKSIGSVDQPKYADTDATPGVDFTYFVKAKNGSGTSAFSTGATGWRALPAPSDVSASDGTSTACVHVGWQGVEGASFYRVYRGTSEGNLAALSSWQSELSYADETATPGTLYYYAVQAALDPSGTRASDMSLTDTGVREKENLPESLTIEGPATLSSGATGSYVAKARWTKGDTSTVSATWSCEGVTETGTSFSYTAPVVSASKSSVVTARATVEGTTLTATYAITVSPSLLNAPSAPTITQQSTSGVTISWTAVAGASSYEVYRGTTTTSSDAVKIDTTLETSYADTSLPPGQTVYYFVAAVNAAGTSALSPASSAAARTLSAPTGVTASDGTHTDKVRVTWCAVAGGTHYRVSRATSLTGSQTDLGSWQSDTTYDDFTATPGTTYYYFVRAATSSLGAHTSSKSAGVKGQRKVAVTLSALAISGSDRINAGATSVYAAKATYSDGTTRTVSPSWSVASGSDATIDSSGKLTAASVSADAQVTIRASYTDGTTVTATKDVAIIAPRVATVSVSNVKASSRWPWKPIVDVDYTINASPADTKAKITVEARDEDRLVDLKPTALTGATGSVRAGAHRISWNYADDYPNYDATKVSIDVKATVASVSAPTSPSASSGTYSDKIVVTWSAVDDATAYEVWRGTSNDSNAATRLAVVTTTSYTDTTANAATTYYYWVKSSDASSTSEFSAVISGYRNVAAPTGVSATLATSADNVTVTWSAVTGANGYEVYRGTSTSMGDATRLTTTASTTYGDTSAVPGTQYCYWVKALCSQGTGSVSASVTGRRLVSPPTNLAVSDGSSTTSVTLTWTAATGASSYQIWRSTSASSAAASRIGTATTTSYNDSTATSGTTYYYWVKSVDAYGSVSSYGAYDSGYASLVAPSLLWGTTNECEVVKISWTAVTGVSRYTVWRSETMNANESAMVGASADCSYCDTSVLPAVKYYYWIRSVGENGEYGVFGALFATGMAALGVPSSISAADNDSTANVRVSWSAVKGATNYRLWRSRYAEFDKDAIILTNVTTTSHTDIYACPGVQYYYWVQAVCGKIVGEKSVAESGMRKESDAPYLVIDMSGGPDAEHYPITYLNSVPSGGWTDEYRKTKLVLRRIPAGTFKMQGGYGKYYSDYTNTTVTITHPFYFSIFELTQGQGKSVVGETGSDGMPVYDYGAPDNDVLPYMAGKSCYGYPSRLGLYEQSDVNVFNFYKTRFIFKLWEKTDFDELTFPTQAQWEYAIRAGSTTDYCSTSQYRYGVPSSASIDTLLKLGRFSSNASDGIEGGTNGVAKVGMYLPNAWGIYDGHGNVREYIFDYWFTPWYNHTNWNNGVDPMMWMENARNTQRSFRWAGCCCQCERPEILRRRITQSNIAAGTNGFKFGFRLATFYKDWFRADQRPVYNSQGIHICWCGVNFIRDKDVRINVYRSTVNNLSSAQCVTVLTNLNYHNFWTDDDVDANTTYYYWLEVVGGRLNGKIAATDACSVSRNK